MLMKMVPFWSSRTSQWVMNQLLQNCEHTVPVFWHEFWLGWHPAVVFSHQWPNYFPFRIYSHALQLYCIPKDIFYQCNLASIAIKSGYAGLLQIMVRMIRNLVSIRGLLTTRLAEHLQTNFASIKKSIAWQLCAKDNISGKYIITNWSVMPVRLDCSIPHLNRLRQYLRLNLDGLLSMSFQISYEDNDCRL